MIIFSTIVVPFSFILTRLSTATMCLVVFNLLLLLLHFLFSFFLGLFVLSLSVLLFLGLAVDTRCKVIVRHKFISIQFVICIFICYPECSLAAIFLQDK